MTNVVLVARKLATLEEHLRRLRERRPADPTRFRADALLQDAIALSVLVVVQEAIDIALHIASDEGWEHASSYRDSFVTLERHGLMDAALTARLAAAAQLRNRIAHGYSWLDVERLWAELPDGMAAFSAFAARVAAFLAQGRHRLRQGTGRSRARARRALASARQMYCLTRGHSSRTDWRGLRSTHSVTFS